MKISAGSSVSPLETELLRIEKSEKCFFDLISLTVQFEIFARGGRSVSF
jgi:hypothetical protein